jgi:membrane protein
MVPRTTGRPEGVIDWPPVPSLRPSLPPIPRRRALANLGRVLTTRATWHRLLVKMKHDRILMRSSALAFETLLSVVPLTAVAMSAVGVIGDERLQRTLLHFLAEQYVPASAGPGVSRFMELIEHLDLSTIGLVGLGALIPVMYSLVDAVELSLSDIFRTPRRAHWFRFLFLAAIVTLAPLGSVLTVRYVPWTGLAIDHIIGPLFLITALLYAVFRMLPSVSLRDRAAMTGALTVGVLLSLAKAGFGLYTTYLARSYHLVWGAVAFVPLLLIWVLLSWALVLLGAEIAAVLDARLRELEQVPGGRRSLPPSVRGRRLRLRLLRKHKRTVLRHSLAKRAQ